MLGRMPKIAEYCPNIGVAIEAITGDTCVCQEELVLLAERKKERMTIEQLLDSREGERVIADLREVRDDTEATFGRYDSRVVEGFTVVIGETTIEMSTQSVEWFEEDVARIALLLIEGAEITSMVAKIKDVG